MSRLPAPRPDETARRPPALLEREVETAVLARHVDALQAGAGGVVVVEGPAGIGKSSLLAAAGRDAESAGLRVLRAGGSPLLQPAGWGVVRQLFGPLLGSPDWDRLAVGAAALARRALDPDAGPPAPGGDSVHAAGHGLTWLACGLADDRPTLLVVDDVGWSDAQSLRWLAQLARQLGELPLGILCAVRPGEVVAEGDVLAELLAAGDEPPVRPRALGPGSVQRLVVERLPGAGQEFTRACHTATAGNPFLLGALVNHVVAEGRAPSPELGARLVTFGPEQVARSVEVQLARLGDGARDLARAFAVLGDGAPLRHARTLAGLDADPAVQLADRLRAAGVLDCDDGGAYRLAHPLVAAALYAAIPPARRALLHARAATLVQRERAGPETVALHLLRSEPCADVDTVSALRTAADRATARGAPDSAAAFLRRALAEPPADAATEFAVRLQLGLALAAQVQPGGPEELHRAVQLAPSPADRARAALSGARALGLAGNFGDALELCHQVVGRPDGVDPELLALLEAELVCNASLRAGSVAEARAHLRCARPAPFWGIPAAWAALGEARPAVDVRALLTTAVDAGVLVEHPDSLLGTWAMVTYIHCGDLDVVAAHCGELIEISRHRGWLIALAHGSFLRAFAHLRAGRIRAAEADARLAFDFKLVHSTPAALAWGLIPLLDALTELDELTGADDVLAAARGRGDPPADGITAALLLESRARLRLAQLRPADAHADLTAAARVWAQLDIRHPGLAAWRVDDCEALVALGDVAAARALAEEQVELATRTGLPEPLGAGLRALAATSGWAEAIDLLEQAVAVLAGSPAQLEHTRALVALGTALRHRNRPAAAREPLRQALDLAERGGMRLLARRARDELLAAGARPRRTALSGVDSLTPAEHRVGALAAQGHGNHAIAQELFVTRGTVETHLTRIFRKLGVGTRAELAPYFAALTGDTSPAS